MQQAAQRILSITEEYLMSITVDQMQADSYTDVQVEAASCAIRQVHEKWKGKAKKISDFVFVLDGVKYDVSFQQLEHALKAELAAEGRTPEGEPNLTGCDRK